jgi:hypothetical protein
MTRDQIDVMWNQALQQSVKDGEQFTRYHFAAMVAAAEREACAKVVEDTKEWKGGGWVSTLCQHTKRAIAAAIRARGQA